MSTNQPIASEVRQASRRKPLWAVLIWCVVIGFVIWHASAMDGYLRRVSAESFQGPAVELPRSQIPQGTAFDGQTWVRQSEYLEAAGGWRLRQSVDDNAPEGRPIYWNSAWAWWLIGGGKLWSVLSGESFGVAMEYTANWVNLPVLVFSLILLGWVCVRRWGAYAGAIYVAILAGHRGFYAAFYPGNPDHHGIIAVCCAGMVLGVVLGGLGWHRSDATPSGVEDDQFPQDASQACRMFTLSAVLGAVGMWFSAASIIPLLGAVGIAVVVCERAHSGGMRFDPSVWRWWGRLGGGLCLCFYFLEQFPDRLGWRLEVNHPVYALAWIGGAELLAWILERRATVWRWPEKKECVRLGVAGVGVILPLLVLVVGGVSVFGLIDPFMTSVHANVTELEPMTRRIALLGWGHYSGYAVLQPLLLLIAIVSAWCLRGRPIGYLLRVCIVIAVLVLILGWWQNRWMLIAGGMVALTGMVVARTCWLQGRGTVRLVMVLLVASLAGWQPWQLGRERVKVAERRDVQADEARQLLFRDVARTIAADAAGRSVLLAAAPDASTGVSYFGDFDSLGTLYWENQPGLLRASHLLAATDEGEAGDLARRWGVTHFALFGFDGGGLRYVTAENNDKLALGPALLAGELYPQWLRPVFYELPPQFSRIESKVRLYATDFEQTPAEAAYRYGMAAIGYGELGHAVVCFENAAASAPDTPAPWMRLGELQLLLNRVPDALNSVLAGVSALPLAEREQAYLDAAKLFASRGATAESNALLDRAVGLAER